jgi:uncharacterized protein YrrD
MLQLSNTLFNRPVYSLRTGQPVATAVSPIINPNNLKIEGFYCSDSTSKRTLVLLYQDIREMIKDGFVINDYDVLVEPDELVRLADVLNTDFSLVGKRVETVDKQKVGKVSDYALESETMYIQKIYVAQSLFKSLTGGSLSIDRTQINEITKKRIVINDLLKDSTVPAPAAIA